MENQILWKGSEVKKLKMSLSMDEIEILKALFTEYQSLHKEMNLTFQKCGLSDQEIEAYRCLQDKELIHDFRAVESDGRIFYTGVMSAEAARVIPHLLELQNVPDKIRRYDILQLIRCGKPMIVFGYYQTPLHVKETGYATFIHVCPWAWKASTRPITQHITISREHIEQYIHLDMTDDGKAYFLIVKPYQYTDKEGNTCGGLELCEDLLDYCYPIFRKTASAAKEFRRIPTDAFIDFRKVFGGYYIKEDFSDGAARPVIKERYSKKEIEAAHNAYLLKLYKTRANAMNHRKSKSKNTESRKRQRKRRQLRKAGYSEDEILRMVPIPHKK